MSKQDNIDDLVDAFLSFRMKPDTKHTNSVETLKIMSTQDIAEDLVDALPSFRINPNYNQAKHTNSEEAMKIQKENIDKTSLTYTMTHANRGIAVIINNEEFCPQTKMNSRSGSTRDVDELKRVLTNKLNFNVIIHNNMTVKQMKRIFEDISEQDHSKNDCFLGVILSHGEDGGIIYGTDGSVVLDDLISYILPNKCPSLAGKPKLFFVQACRGTKFDEGFEVKDADGSFDEADSAQKIPLWVDVFIAYSSVPGYYSWRNSKNGSWFIQSLCYMLERYGNDLEIHQIMTKVNFHVAYEYESKSNDSRMNRRKQVPCVSSMLTKELKFGTK